MRDVKIRCVGSKYSQLMHSENGFLLQTIRQCFYVYMAEAANEVPLGRGACLTYHEDPKPNGD